MTSVTILNGDALAMLRTLPSESVQCAVTSPPYFGLRDYGVEGQIGLEASPEDYVNGLVEAFREMRRVLRSDGTFWLNIGECYALNGQRGPVQGLTALADAYAPRKNARQTNQDEDGKVARPKRAIPTGLKPKDRMMIPARVALALQADGWWLRDEIVWHKPRTTPFPANDRTVAAHEMVYLFSKRERYFFDWAAIEEPAAYPGVTRQRGKAFRLQGAAKATALATMEKENAYGGKGGETMTVRETRRARSVWSISPQPYRDAHFATMPPTLAERCLHAGSAKGDVVLDPFGGAGTTALAAVRNGRSAVLIELNRSYCILARRRLAIPVPLPDLMFEAAQSRLDLTKALTP